MTWKFWNLLRRSKKAVRANRLSAPRDTSQGLIVSQNIEDADEINQLERNPIRAVRAEVPESFSDVLAGHEFCATLQFKTPLRILEMHGTFVPSNQELPDYREVPKVDPYGQFGIWVPKAKSWEELGFTVMRELPKSGVASDVGTVDPAEYLPFLKAFRQIVESDQAPKVKFDEIKKLRDRNSEWCSFYDTLSKNYHGDVAKIWFVQDISSIKGVGWKTAEKIFDTGLLTAEQVKQASDETLLSIQGVGKALVEKIRLAE